MNPSKNRLKVDWLGTASIPSTWARCRVALQPGHPRELVRAAEDAAHLTQDHAGPIVGVGTGGVVGQECAQLLPEAFRVQELRPDAYVPVGGQAWWVNEIRMEEVAS